MKRFTLLAPVFATLALLGITKPASAGDLLAPESLMTVDPRFGKIIAITHDKVGSKSPEGDEVNGVGVSCSGCICTFCRASPGGIEIECIYFDICF